jgi:DnaK suppressor protein
VTHWEAMDATRDPGADDLDLDAIERELRELHAEMQGRMGELAKPPERGANLSFGKRIGDGTSEAISRLTDVGVGASLDETDMRVIRALEKLAEGTYGTCDRCGEPIAVARLQAMPESVLCIACAALTR